MTEVKFVVAKIAKMVRKLIPNIGLVEVVVLYWIFSVPLLFSLPPALLLYLRLAPMVVRGYSDVIPQE